MRKSWLYGGRKQMAAAGLAVMLAAGAVTGCSGGTEGTAAESGNTSSDQKAGEEKGVDVKTTRQELYDAMHHI